MTQPQNNNRAMEEKDWETAPANPATIEATDKGAWKLGQVKLREWLAETEKTVVCAGVYDALTARIAVAQGFDCLYLHNAATTLARSGLVGTTALSQRFVLDLAQIVQQVDMDVVLIGEVDKSLGVDAVKSALSRFHHAEIAAMQLDDETSQQCSDRNLPRTRAIENALLDRIRAAVDERARIHSDIVIIAKTNMLKSCGCKNCFSRAMKLLQATVGIGADVVSLSGRLSGSETESIVRERFKDFAVMRAPHTSTTAQMRTQGVKIISYPELFTNALVQGVSPIMRDFRATGNVGHMKPVPYPDHAEHMGGLQGLVGL